MKILDGQSLLAESGLESFKRGSTFGALGEEAIRFLLSHGRIVAMSDGEELFRPDDAGDSFFVVLQGDLDYFRESRLGEILILTVAFGQQLGYVSMIGLFQRVGVARSRGETVVLEVNSDLFYQLHVEFPFDFGILLLNLSREMARMIRKVTSDFAEVCAAQSIA